ncbi:RNA-directed DNA polymerase [Bradyrhizobium sp. S3.2.6]|uniref:RNase H family protein n=1 Tax=Bradyrhizobium sp. S3.2.6 TaxID=3156428 RepID=UPI00339A25DA
MGRLFDKVTERSSLRNAWYRIRANGVDSLAAETRVAVEMFGRDVDRNIYKIQKRLRDGSFEFDPQKGVLKKKANGGRRGIVMASVQNRIVERAWLDCLQDRSSYVKGVINQLSSIGGVPNRSVPHGLKLIRDAFVEGKAHYVRSDISGFFDGIPRDKVLAKLESEIEDQRFIEVLRAATRVVLSNESILGENRRLFPIDGQGVAQGSPLSPLFGNILLNDFDIQLNGREITCVRFIDDFVLIGRTEAAVSQAFRSARKILLDFGLTCHDPYEPSASREKAGFGKVEDGFVFLGYDLRPGLFQPSRLARQKLAKKVDECLADGRSAIIEAKKLGDNHQNRQRYTQTLTLLDKIIRGWGNAFSYGNSIATIADLDQLIDQRIDAFRLWFSKQLAGSDWKNRRRLGGVCLLSDIRIKDLDDVPFSIEPGKRFSRSLNTATVSTDGSIISTVRRKGKDQGPGGWAFVVHETNERIGGSVASTTNNQMELLAAIEAIKHIDSKRSIIIRTDSQYVADAANGKTIVKQNTELWKEFNQLKAARKIKVVWVKGHAGDPHNEAAHLLAEQWARSARDNALRPAA